eukprot:2789368-Pyramimonas_sp.AAC.1
MPSNAKQLAFGARLHGSALHPPHPPAAHRNACECILCLRRWLLVLFCFPSSSFSTYHARICLPSPC